MPPVRPPIPPIHQSVHGRAERGFSVIELVVAMVIVLMISAMVATSFFSGRGSANDQRIRITATAVDDAVRAFRRDHGSRTPVLANARDWPDARRGPRDRNAEPYMRKVDESLGSGDVTVVASGTAGGTIGRLRYERPSSTTYRLVAERRSGSRWEGVCWYGTTSPGGTVPRC